MIAFTDTGLGEEFVDAGVARLAHLIDLGVTGEHDDRHERVGRLRRGADLLGEFEPRHALHLPIQHDNVGIGITHHNPSAFAVGGFVDLICAEGLQDRGDELAHMHVVVDNQNSQPVESVTAHPAQRVARNPRQG